MPAPKKKAKLALDLLVTDAGQSLVESQLASVEEQLRDIDRRQRELETERRQLQSLLSGSSRGSRKARRNGKSRRTRKVATDKVMAAVKELAQKEPPTKAQVAEKLGVRETSRLTPAFVELLEAGKLERQGKARGTRYKPA